jgi:hypothetical protein
MLLVSDRLRRFTAKSWWWTKVINQEFSTVYCCCLRRAKAAALWMNRVWNRLFDPLSLLLSSVNEPTYRSFKFQGVYSPDLQKLGLFLCSHAKFAFLYQYDPEKSLS